MPTCSICGPDAPPGAADIVDRLLNENESIDRVIVPQTKFSRPAIYRHRKNPHCSFRRSRALRIKPGKGKNSGASRIIVAWPGDSCCADELQGTYNSFFSNAPITASDLRPDDLVFCIEYRQPLPVESSNTPELPK
jgi:hypothetical protein